MLSKLFVQTIWLMLNARLPSGSQEFGMDQEEDTHATNPQNNLGC